MKSFLGFLALLFFYSPLSFSSGSFSSSQTAKSLKTKDYEEMRALVNQAIRKARSQVPNEELLMGHEPAVEELKKALRLVLMRPDTDNVLDPLVVSLQNEIMNFRSFLPVFAEVVDQALSQFGKGSLGQQASYLYIIENSLAYLQSAEDPVSLSIIKKISLAQLKISKKLANYLIMEMGRGKTASPSYLATIILQKQSQKKQAEGQNTSPKNQAQARVPSAKQNPKALPEESTGQKTPDNKKRWKVVPIDFINNIF